MNIQNVIIGFLTKTNGIIFIIEYVNGEKDAIVAEPRHYHLANALFKKLNHDQRFEQRLSPSLGRIEFWRQA